MTSTQAERMIAVLERIAKLLEGPTAEERLADGYLRSKLALIEADRRAQMLAAARR